MLRFNSWRKSKDRAKYQPSQPTAGSGQGPDADPQAVAHALAALLTTKSWDETRSVLEREQALLLTDTAEHLLNGMIQQAQQSKVSGWEQQANYLMLHLALLQGARMWGIPAAWSAFEATLQQAEQDLSSTPQVGEGITFTPKEAELAIQWVSMSHPRDERRFLEAHPELLNPRMALILESLITFAKIPATEFAQISGGSPEEMTTAIAQSVHDHLRLLRDIHIRGDTITAIREGYVNAHGGLALDLPPWLEKVETQLHELRHAGQPDKTAEQRVALLRDALVHAQSKADLAPEILAELNTLLWEALYSAEGINKQQMQEEGIACLQAALQVYTYDRYPCRYAGTQNNLGVAYFHRIGREQRTNLEQAITCYREALRVYTLDAFPEQYAGTQHNLGQAYIARIEGERGTNLEQAMACCREALRVYTLDAFPEDYAAIQNNLGAVYAERREGEPRANLEQAIACYQEALRVCTLDAFPEQYATNQHALGDVYTYRIEGERRANLEQAIACYHEALRVYILDAFPEQYATIQNNLGDVYAERTEGERRANLEQAIACYHEALRVHTLDAFSEQYALTQTRLSEAYFNRIEGERRANLEQAIVCSQEALRIYTADAFPNLYALIQAGLGQVYTYRIEGERRANLEQAITCCRQALRVYTFDAFPEQYALTQHNLGLAYTYRIEGERRANLEQAITCYQEALRVYTFDAFPEQYALTQHNLGLAYINRIEGKRRANLEQAITCFQEALRIYTPDTYPERYVRTQHNLGEAYTYRIEGERRANLEQAIACYREALRVRTLEALPEQYAMTQHNLGNAYTYRIEGERRANLEQAITCYHEALRIYTLDAFPERYAGTQNNLGLAYEKRIEGERRANLERAITCYHEALRVYTLDAFPEQYRQTQINRALAEAARQNWAGAHDAYNSALSAEDLLVALGAGTLGRDVVLREGRDASLHDGFALTRLTRLSDAAVTIERGRARGLAEAMALDAADPGLIRDVERRARYQTAREQLIAAQKSLNTPLPRDLTESEQRRLNLEYTEAYRQAKCAFDAIVAEIRAAGDPADFLETVLDPSTILQAAERGGPGHALVYLAATPWGGVAVAALNANPSLPIPDRFAALDLPSLTFDLMANLAVAHLGDDTPRIIGGLAVAQVGNILGIMLEEWPGATFRVQAAALHAACTATSQASALDAAAQVTLAIPAIERLVDQPFSTWKDTDLGKLAGTLDHRFLSLEVQRCLEVLADIALRPLVAWLREQGATSLTLIPCGPLAAFPLAAVPLADGRTVGETLPTSVAPSARSLLHDEQTTTQRVGVYALGNPRPTHQELQWGEAEAHTLAKLASRLELPAEVRVHEAATRAWLTEVLQNGQVVDASCHGGFSLSEPLQSALLLAKGELLTLGDMLSHVVDLRGLRLLILSACQTAIVDLFGARDEVHSLAAGMVQAGAQAVLAALWPVDDKATYLLMVRFAQEWLPHLKSEPPAAALARAQRWLRTVTNRKLQTWHAGDFPAPTEEEQSAAGSQTPEREVWEEAREPAGASKGQVETVRGRDYRSETDETELSVSESRFGMGEAELRVQARGRNDPNACPFADPIYWAGFQLTGW